MRARTVWIASGGLMAAVLLAGCGDGGVSAEEFQAQATEICQEHRAVIEEAASEVLAGGQMPDPQEFGQLAMGTIVPELTAQFQELRALEAPDDVADDFEAYLTEGEEVVGQLQQNPVLLTDAANFSEVNELADDAGLSEACHIGPE